MPGMTAATQAQDAAEDKRLDAIWDQRCTVLNKAWVQVRYQRRRQRFFDLADKFTKSITVVLGASLMGRFFVEWLPWLATAITSLGLLALVFGYSDRKQLHKDLAEQAAKLVADIEMVPVAGLNFDKTAAWGAEYARLVAESPPPLKTLTMVCEREQAALEGYPEHVPMLPWYKRLVGHFY
jgi:hypothetical protein